MASLGVALCLAEYTSSMWRWEEPIREEGQEICGTQFCVGNVILFCFEIRSHLARDGLKLLM